MLVRTWSRTMPRPVPVAVLVFALVLGSAPPASAVPTEVPRRSASFNDVVHAVVSAGDTIYVGGAFTRATDATGSAVRNHVAAVDADTGQLRAWNPDADGVVMALAVAGGEVYLGGSFDRVGASRREGLAKVSAGSGAVRRGFVHGTSGVVRTMAVLRGALYVGGSFTRIDDRSRPRLAKFDLGSGALTSSWTPRADGSVLTLAKDAGRILVGGRFDELNGRSSNGFLAAVDRRTGAIAAGFDPQMSYPVHDLAVTSAAVYAAADGSGGHLRAFQRNGDDMWDLPTDGGVQAVAALAGTVYFGGHFDNACRSARIGTTGSCRAGTVSRRKLGAVDARGDLAPWAPQADSALGVVALDAAAPSGRVLVGGAFTRFGGGRFHQPAFAVFG
jgi:hypothetical protein